MPKQISPNCNINNDARADQAGTPPRNGLAHPESTIDIFDKPLTMKAAAAVSGLPYFAIQRAVKAGIVPSYRLLSGKKYVKLHDIFDRMSKQSGQPDSNVQVKS